MDKVARWVSIAGHPFVTGTLMVLGSRPRGGSTAGAASNAIAFVLIAVVPIAILMIRQVRRGKWEHVDATHRHERPMLFVAGAAAALAWFGYVAMTEPGSPLMRGLVVTMAMIAVSAILTRWVKVSLHMAFAAYSATSLLFFGSPIGWVIAVMVPLLIWSRLRLRRHTPVEVALGLVIGTASGLALHLG